MAKPDSNTIVDPFVDAALAADADREAVVIKEDGDVTILNSQKNIYITTVKQTTDQNFINNDVNSPKGPNLSLQYNLAGNLAGDADLIFAPVSKTLRTPSLEVPGVARLGNASSVKIGGGVNGYVLGTDGTGNLSWNPPLSGNGTVGGANATIQFNNSGNFSGSTSFRFDTGNNQVLIDNLNANVQRANAITTNQVVSNAVNLGNSTVVLTTSTWQQGQTNSTTPNQILYLLPATDSTSIDFHITATDGTSARQVTKILAVNIGTTTNYTQYADMSVGSRIASFDVSQGAGTIRLVANPTTANVVNYSIITTIYK